MQWESSEPGVIALPSGRLVRGRSVREAVDEPPDWGLYLLIKPPRFEWPHRWVCWPDLGLPIRSTAARRAIREAWTRSEFERVVVGCGGGIGRTGTALAAMAMHDGLTAEEAVAWVRVHYHRRAIETPWQRRWLAR